MGRRYSRDVSNSKLVERMSRQSFSKIMQPRKYLEAVLILAAAFGVVLITVGTQAAFAKVPQFKDYAVRKVHSGQIAQPDLNVDLPRPDIQQLHPAIDSGFRV